VLYTNNSEVLGNSLRIIYQKISFYQLHNTPSVSSDCKPQLCKRHILTNSSIGRIKVSPVSN
jgi:hypothetical protein